MKKLIFLILVLAPAVFSQTVPRYEAEMLKNPNKGGKDTREVNAVLAFEKDALKITSRRRLAMQFGLVFSLVPGATPK